MRKGVGMRILDNISIDRIIESEYGIYLEITVPDSAVNDFCLCLNLLSYELIPSFRIGQLTVIEIACDSLLVRTDGSSCSCGSLISAHLSRDALGYMSAFYLRDSQQNKCSSPRSLPSRLCDSDFSRQPKWNSLILESP